MLLLKKNWRNIANKNSTIIISTFEMNFAKLWVEMYWCTDYNYVQYSKFYKINKWNFFHVDAMSYIR